MRAIALMIAFTVMAAAAEVPRKADNIEITLPDGRKLNPAADLRGKIVCLAFILTT